MNMFLQYKLLQDKLLPEKTLQNRLMQADALQKKGLRHPRLQGRVRRCQPHAARIRRALRVAALVLAACVSGFRPVHADVYKYVDSEGHVYLTDRPPHDGYRLILRTRKGWREPRINYRGLEANRSRYAAIIAEAARAERLPEALVHAVVTAESAYDAEAVSSAGAVGLMQLMPDTAKRFGVRDRRNPAANVRAGTRYLALLLEQFDNNLALALAGYNAGENAVEKYGRTIPPYPETRNYVNKVLRLYKDYRTRPPVRVKSSDELAGTSPG